MCNLFAIALMPTLNEFTFQMLNVVCLTVKIWLKFKAVHSIGYTIGIFVLNKETRGFTSDTLWIQKHIS